MPKDTANLAALIGSRLCHDLISPIGAIQNGLELMSLSGQAAASPEMTLIQESCDNATARIRFFRIAFGSAGDSQSMSRRDIVSVLEDMARGGRLATHWMPDGDVPRSETQLAFLGLMCCETALPLGGDVEVARSGSDWRITASGRRLAVDPALFDHLAGLNDAVEITPSKVQFALLAVLAKDRGCRIDWRADDDALSMSITVPDT